MLAMVNDYRSWELNRLINIVSLPSPKSGCPESIYIQSDRTSGQRSIE